MKPSYINLYESGELKSRLDLLKVILEDCTLCPRECRVNRLNGEQGFCKSGARLMVSSIGPHFGEEPPLVGHHGSGTIFLTGCNLSCVFCQNYEISQMRDGKEFETHDLARGMLALQKMGCHNINFVTPTHYIPQIVDALLIAVQNGLRIPLVYNCGGYESINAIRLLDGIFDIYMPDIKYGDNEAGMKYSKAPGYFDVVTDVVAEMYRQVGDLVINSDGIAEKGLLIRHLVLPSGLAATEKVVRFITKLSTESYVNIMDQYRPQYKANEYPELNRRISSTEFNEAILIAKKAGLNIHYERKRW